MFIGFKTSSPTQQVYCQGNSEVGLFQDATVHDTNNTGQYRLGLQIDHLDRNRLHTTQKTLQQNRELSTE